jgi:hypothetical protein
LARVLACFSRKVLFTPLDWPSLPAFWNLPFFNFNALNDQALISLMLGLFADSTFSNCALDFSLLFIFANTTVAINLKPGAFATA